MTHIEPEHDTDPTELKGNGKPATRCAFHEADMVEVKKMFGELRELTIIQSRSINDLQDSSNQRLLSLEKEMFKLVAVIGHPPDPTTGTPGIGMRGQWVTAINRVIQGDARREMPSITADESEITGSFDRETLVIAKRKAERGRKAYRVQAIGAVIVAVIAAVGAVATQVIPLLRGG